MTLKKILLKREYGGFLLGAVCAFAVMELSESWGALACLLVVFAGFPLVRKFSE
jgi:hypothetical protein